MIAVSTKFAHRHSRHSLHKSINDACSHLGGDAALKQWAIFFTEPVTRAGDVVARYGGEEISILLCIPNFTARWYSQNALASGWESTLFSPAEIPGLSVAVRRPPPYGLQQRSV